jgi:hypothetical protein
LKPKFAIHKKEPKQTAETKKIPADKLALIDELEEKHQTDDDQTYRDIRGLERKIEQGEPLEGCCLLCPAVSVSSN